jgi:hypothetical protein
MTLILFAIIGFLVGYKFRTTPKAYIIMATVTISFFICQFTILLATIDKSQLTILPALIGFLFMFFMFIGSLSHLMIGHKTKTVN